jgi:hypothetical protein
VIGEAIIRCDDWSVGVAILTKTAKESSPRGNLAMLIQEVGKRAVGNEG